MAKTNITTATTTQVETDRINKIRITINNTVVNTVTVLDQNGATGGTTVATITNPSQGQSFEYWDFGQGVRIVTTGAQDITVNTDGGRAVK